MNLFDGFDLEAAIGHEAGLLGLPLAPEQLAALAEHARRVDASNERLHLTAIRDPGVFVERHIGESLAGALLLDAEVRGTLVDLGSGNGYPGIPLALARPGLRPVLVESAPRKAAFLSLALEGAGLSRGSVLEANVQRASDLGPVGPVTVLATRAMGGWERLLPKLAPAMEPGGCLLVWAGDDLDAVARRTAWGRWRMQGARPLRHLERGRIARFELR